MSSILIETNNNIISFPENTPRNIKLPFGEINKDLVKENQISNSFESRLNIIKSLIKDYYVNFDIYDIKRRIGEESNDGMVFLAECNGKTYALKKNHDNETILIEFFICKFLNSMYDSENIVRTFGWTVDHSTGTYYCIFEFLPGETVSSKLENNLGKNIILYYMKKFDYNNYLFYKKFKNLLIDHNCEKLKESYQSLRFVVRLINLNLGFKHGGIHGNNIMVSNNKFVLFDFSKSSVIYNDIHIYGRRLYDNNDQYRLTDTFEYYDFETEVRDMFIDSYYKHKF